MNNIDASKVVRKVTAKRPAFVVIAVGVIAYTRICAGVYIFVNRCAGLPVERSKAEGVPNCTDVKPAMRLFHASVCGEGCVCV